MTDPALQSVHLDLSRREEFRRARDVLFASRGNQTVCLESAERGFAPPAAPEVAPSVVDAQVVVDGKPQLLKVGVNTIGRLPDNDLVIHDAHASRRHCAIVVHASRVCEVHDMASKNGTYLNGAKVAGPTRLKSGDEISVGEFRLVFVAPGCSLSGHGSADGHTQKI